MTICSKYQLSFQGCKGRKVEAEFSGGNVTSDGGLLLLRQADRRLELILIRIQVEFNDPAPSGQSMNAFVIRLKGCQGVA